MLVQNMFVTIEPSSRPFPDNKVVLVISALLTVPPGLELTTLCLLGKCFKSLSYFQGLLGFESLKADWFLHEEVAQEGSFSESGKESGHLEQGSALLC